MELSLKVSSPSYWLEAARPKTLTAAVVPVIVATALAWAAGYSPRWHLSFFALLSALCIQIGTNLVNDAIDFAKGTDNEERIGPRRVTQSGLLSQRTVMIGAFVTFALAALFALPLIAQGGWVIVAIGIVSLLCGYAYTGGPLPLAYVGLGEVFVIAFFGWAATVGVYYLHTERLLDGRPWIAGLQIGALSTVLIAINNLRDREGDIKSGKKTLAARLGVGFARMEIAVMLFLPFVLGLYWISYGYWAATFLPLLVLPMAMGLIRDIFATEPSPAYNGFLARGGAIQLVFGILFTIGCFITWGRT